MGNMTRDSLDSYMQTSAGAKLRAFDKTITYNVQAYLRYYGADNAFGVVLKSQYNFFNAGLDDSSADVTQRYEYTGAANSLFDDYIDAGVSAGSIVYAQDIVDTIEDGVKRTVDLVETRLDGRSWTTLLCHSSCHTSCHTSRGRR